MLGCSWLMSLLTPHPRTVPVHSQATFYYCEPAKMPDGSWRYQLQQVRACWTCLCVPAHIIPGSSHAMRRCTGLPPRCHCNQIARLLRAQVQTEGLIQIGESFNTEGGAEPDA